MRWFGLLLGVLVPHFVAAAEINVYAASSLTDALKEIGRIYETRSGHRIAFNFAASNTLARQISEGAPADIFFSADQAQMDALEKRELIQPGSRRDLLGNTLLVIAPSDSKLTLKSVEDLRQVGRIAVGDPKLVPVGVYARSYLEKLGLWRELEPKIIPTENVRAGMAVVESGNADAGFVYATDARISTRVKVVLEIPPGEAPPIRYPIALVKQKQPKPEARELIEFLAGEEARAVFEKFAFIVVPK